MICDDFTLFYLELLHPIQTVQQLLMDRNSQYRVLRPRISPNFKSNNVNQSSGPVKKFKMSFLPAD